MTRNGVRSRVNDGSRPAPDDSPISRRGFLASAVLLAAGCAEQPIVGVTIPTAPLPLTVEHTPPVLGINSHSLSHEDLQLLRSLHIQEVRSTIITTLWNAFPSYRNRIRENTLRAKSYGMRLVYVVHNAYGPPFRWPYTLSEARRFTETVATMLEALPEVEAWQLWNEQNVWMQAPFGAGSTPPLPPEWIGWNYGEWWKEAYARLKDAHPHVLLVTGATADDASASWQGFLEGFAETGAQADAIAVHAYGTAESRLPILDRARDLFVNSPVWVTECGAPPGPLWTAERQLDSWRSFVDRSGGRVQRVYPYCLQTDPHDPWYGMWNVDGTERPVLTWLRSRAV